MKVVKVLLPVLSGVINAPTLRADGSMLSKPGYDSATGLLFAPNGSEFPDIPDRPSHAEAKDKLS
jgi:putative DNA primase/helicase